MLRKTLSIDLGFLIGVILLVAIGFFLSKIILLHYFTETDALPTMDKLQTEDYYNFLSTNQVAFFRLQVVAWTVAVLVLLLCLSSRIWLWSLLLEKPWKKIWITSLLVTAGWLLASGLWIFLAMKIFRPFYAVALILLGLPWILVKSQTFLVALVNNPLKKSFGAAIRMLWSRKALIAWLCWLGLEVVGGALFLMLAGVLFPVGAMVGLLLLVVIISVLRTRLSENS